MGEKTGGPIHFARGDIVNFWTSTCGGRISALLLKKCGRAWNAMLIAPQYEIEYCGFDGYKIVSSDERLGFVMPDTNILRIVVKDTSSILGKLSPCELDRIADLLVLEPEKLPKDEAKQNFLYAQHRAYYYCIVERMNQQTQIYLKGAK